MSWTVLVANPIALKQLLFKPGTSIYFQPVVKKKTTHIFSLLEHVFPKRPTLAPKGTLLDRYIGGPNILLQSGPIWRKHKKVFILLLSLEGGDSF